MRPEASSRTNWQIRLLQTVPYGTETYRTGRASQTFGYGTGILAGQKLSQRCIMAYEHGISLMPGTYRFLRCGEGEKGTKGCVPNNRGEDGG